MLDKLTNLVRASIYRREKNLDTLTWIFSSVDNNNFNYNSKYLFLYVRKHFPHIRSLYVINDSQKRARLKQQYGEEGFIDGNSPEGMKIILKAGVWFTSAGLPAYELQPHPQRIVLNLWHGIPLKKITLMEEGVSFFQRMYFRQIFSKKYTGILTTSHNLVPVMAKSFAVSYDKVKVWGQPRNDLIWEDSQSQKVFECLDLSEEEAKGLILYAPTYRDKVATRLFPFSDFNGNELEEFLGQRGWHMCIRMHLEEQGGSGQYESSHVHFLNEDVIDDIAQWLNGFDMLITDYSSIYLDYLLTKKPLMFLPYDKEEYLSERGMNFAYEEVTPGPKPKNQLEFFQWMEHLMAGDDDYKEARHRCNDFFNEIQEPCSSKICEKVMKII